MVQLIRYYSPASLAFLFFLLSSRASAQADMSIQERMLLTRIMMAQKNEVINLEAGTIDLTSSIWIDGKDGVQLIGAGAGKTILNFKGQTGGTEAIRMVSCKALTISGITIRNAATDGIRVQNCQNITFSDVAVEWKDRDQRSMKTGAMGFACFTSDNIRFEHCQASGAVGAGFMVAHSTLVSLTDCISEGNSSGIMMQNVDSGSISLCTVRDNALGIGLLNMPGGVKQRGRSMVVYSNTIQSNRRTNNSAPGDFLNRFPGGVGILCLGSQQAVLQLNTISDNATTGVLLTNYAIMGLPKTGDEAEPFFLSDVFLHENQFAANGKEPQMQSQVGKLIQDRLQASVFPDIVYDGILPPGADVSTPSKICIQDKATFVNLKQSQMNPVPSFDLAPFDCKLPELSVQRP